MAGKKNQKTKLVVDRVKYEFTEDDLRNLGRYLADEIQNIKDLEDQKAAVTADFTSRIKEHRFQVSSLSGKIRDGHEYREAEVKVLLDFSEGRAKFVNPWTGAIYRQRDLTQDERQLEITDTPGGGQNAEIV